MREYITINGMRCEVQRLRRTRFDIDRGAPSHEVIAPDDYEFSGGETVLCINTEQDLRDIELRESLTEAQ